MALARRAIRPQSYVMALGELRDVPRWKRINTRLKEYSERNGSFFFVQIGAHDGSGHDPVRKHILGSHWQGLLVEPVPHTFTRLKENYSDHSGLRFANVAVTDHIGTATMLAAIELPGNAHNPLSRVSSLDPRIVREHSWMVRSIDSFVAPLEVQATTLAGLLTEHDIHHVDGLFVDTEGHDRVVLDQLGKLAEDIQPYFIAYEHKHLSPDDQVGLSRSLLMGGYDLTHLRKDTFAELQTA